MSFHKAIKRTNDFVIKFANVNGSGSASANELFDLTRGGQGMFMISVSSVWRELEGTLSTLPGERTVSRDQAEEHPDDELAARRRSHAV